MAISWYMTDSSSPFSCSDRLMRLAFGAVSAVKYRAPRVEQDLEISPAAIRSFYALRPRFMQFYALRPRFF